MTLMQRILRGPINFAVERFFPNGCFYGDADPMKDFERADDGTVGRAAALILIRHAYECRAGEIKNTLSGVTINGENIGDWSVTVTEITK